MYLQDISYCWSSMLVEYDPSTRPQTMILLRLGTKHRSQDLVDKIGQQHLVARIWKPGSRSHNVVARIWLPGSGSQDLVTRIW